MKVYVWVHPRWPSVCVWRISASQQGLTGETFDSCAPQVQRSCQVLHEPKVKCFSGPRTSQWVSFASTVSRAAGNGTSVICQRLEKKRIAKGPHVFSLPKQKRKWKVWTFKLPNLELKGVICMVNSPGSIYYQSAPLLFYPLPSLSLLFHFLLYFLHPHPPLLLFPL